MKHLLFVIVIAHQLATQAWSADKPVAKTLYIVAPKVFHPALKQYVEFKQTFLQAELVELEDVLKTTRGSDDPERLKRFLYAAWRDKQLGYVLLVGDVDVMPVRYMVLDRATKEAFDFAFYPSDLYYADLAKQDGKFDDWNARKDGIHARYFGEVRGEKNKKDAINFDQVDYRPEIAVGRWPVSSVDEVKNVAAKSIQYETGIRDGTHPGLRRAEIFHPGGFIDARERLDGMVRRMPRGWTIDRFYFTDANPRYKTPSPDERIAVASFNKGVGLGVHVGHGGGNCWEQCFFLSSLPELHNSDRLPVLISIGCSTAYFAPLPPYEGYVDVDGREHAGTNRKEVFTAPPPPPAPYQKGKFNPTGLGEQLIRRGASGAVVYIGCNTGAQPCAMTLLEGFMNALGRAQRPLAGDCWTSAIHHYYEAEHLATLAPNDDWYPPSIFFQGMKFMFFGDPTLPLASSASVKK